MNEQRRSRKKEYFIHVCLQTLSHVSLGSENDGFEAIVREAQLLEVAELEQTLEDLSIVELSVTQYGASRLNRLDNLLRIVAGQTEASRARVDLHYASQRLLSTVGHAVRLVQYDDLVLAFLERHLFLGKHLDLVADHVDAAVVGRVHLEHCLLVHVFAEQLASQAQN